MPVSAERLRQIRELSNDERVDRIDTSGFTDVDWEKFDAQLDAETIAFCRDTRDPEELHAFASTYNWDKGTWALELILHNPACEAATALFIYWHAQPEYYRQFANRDAVPEFQREDFDFIASIESRYIAGEFRRGVIRFDPRDPADYPSGMSNVGAYDRTGNRVVRDLPVVMYESVELR